MSDAWINGLTYTRIWFQGTDIVKGNQYTRGKDQGGGGCTYKHWDTARGQCLCQSININMSPQSCGTAHRQQPPRPRRLALRRRAAHCPRRRMVVLQESSPAPFMARRLLPREGQRSMRHYALRPLKQTARVPSIRLWGGLRREAVTARPRPPTQHNESMSTLCCNATTGVCEKNLLPCRLLRFIFSDSVYFAAYA